MGSKISKSVKGKSTSSPSSGEHTVRKGGHTGGNIVHLTERCVQTHRSKMSAPGKLIERSVQTEPIVIRTLLSEGIYNYLGRNNKDVDDMSIFSDVTSLSADLSFATEVPVLKQVQEMNDPCAMSPDSACFSSATCSEDMHKNGEMILGAEAPVPTKRHRRVPEPQMTLPNLEAAEFECCMWVPAEEVARIFATSKDRRIEAIGRACNCRFLLTDTHRVNKNLGVQQLVYILSDTRADLEKCRGMLDDKFPSFYAKSSDVVHRQASS